jgi:hypothetical protein
MLGAVEQLERALHLQLRVRRDGVHVARLARRLVGRRGVRAVQRHGAVVLVRGLAGQPLAAARGQRVVAVLAPPAAQAAEERHAAIAPRAGAGREVQALADPALVGGARRAQLAHHPARAARQEDVGLLAAKQRPTADVAVDRRV